MTQASPFPQSSPLHPAFAVPKILAQDVPGGKIPLFANAIAQALNLSDELRDNDLTTLLTSLSEKRPILGGFLADYNDGTRGLVPCVYVIESMSVLWGYPTQFEITVWDVANDINRVCTYLFDVCPDVHPTLLEFPDWVNCYAPEPVEDDDVAF